MKQIWVIDEGHAGHTTQSMGLAHRMLDIHNGIIQQISIGHKARGIVKSAIKTMLRLNTNMSLLSILHGRFTLPSGKPDVIISSGAKSLPLASYLQSTFGCPAFFCGVNRDILDFPNVTCITPFADEARSHDIHCPLQICSVDQHDIIARGQEWREINNLPNEQMRAILIGGASRSHPYTEHDWLKLCNSMVSLWERDGIQWLVTTSRRTGHEAEKIINAKIPSQACAAKIIYGKTPLKVVKAFLGAAHHIYVTRDSMSMLTEAIYSGKPVTALYSKDHIISGTNPVEKYARYLLADSWIDMQTFDQMDRDTISFGHDTNHIINACATQVWARIFL